MSRSLTDTLVHVLADYENPRSLGSRLRARRVGPLLDMIAATRSREGRVRIIDVGGTETYWGIVPPGFLERNNVTITVVNLPGTDMPEDHGRFEFVVGDGCSLDAFEDCSFHIAHSNSVIEHVGDWERMVAFSREVARVASAYFVQTPNFWFPVEPHYLTPFFHWLPRPLQVWLVLHFNLGQCYRRRREEDAVLAVEGTRLLDRGMLRALFPDAQIITERFLGLSKSLTAMRM